MPATKLCQRAQTPAAAPTVPDNPNVPPSRRGRRAVTIYLDPEAHTQLKIVALEQGSSAQALVTEAINNLFEHYGKPRIA